jgi:hypothetical protein
MQKTKSFMQKEDTKHQKDVQNVELQEKLILDKDAVAAVAVATETNLSTKLLVVLVAVKQPFHLNLEMIDQFIVLIVTEIINNHIFQELLKKIILLGNLFLLGF